MSNKCNIKDNIDALNHGLDSFEKAFKFTGGNTTKALKFALSEMKSEYPDIDFDPNTFTDHVSDIMKDAGLIPKSYKFGKGAKKEKSQDEKIKKLAEDIASGKEKEKSTTKEKEDFTDEQKKIRSFVSSKYGKSLSKSELDALLKESVGDKSIKSIIDERLAIIDEEKSVSEKLKQAEKENKVKEKGEFNTEAAKEKYKSEVNKVVNKFTGLNEDQKKTVSSDLMNDLIENGLINDKDVLNAISKATGKPEISEKILDASDALSEANTKLEKVKDKITEAIKNKADKKTLDALAKEQYVSEDAVMKAGLELSRLVPPYSFWYHDNIMAAQLNLMTVKSFWKNITGASDMAIRYMGSSVGAVVGLGFQIFTKTNPLPFGQKALGVINAIRDKKIQRQAKLAFKYGSAEVSGDIPSHNFFDSVNKLRNGLESWNKDKKAKALLEWTQMMLRVSPEIASKALATPDQAVYTAVYESELNSIAATKGLKGDEKAAFLLKPDESSALYAHDKARTATYKNDPSVKAYKKVLDMLSYDPRKHYQEMVSEGSNPAWAKIVTSVYATAKIITVPFVKTPAALVNFTYTYIVPELALAKTLAYDFRKQEDPNLKNRIIAESVGKYVASVTLRYIAINMVANGLISAGFGDDDERATDIQEQAKGGSAKINMSALWRAMMCQGYSSKKSDSWQSLSFYGGTGMILGTYAHMYSKMTDEEKKALADQNPLDPKFYLSSPTAPVAVIKSAMENTFLSGTNMIFKLLTEENEDRGSKFAINAATLMMTGAFNSHLQEISKSYDPHLKKQYDKELSFHENLLNKFGYNFLLGSTGPGMKNKIFSLAKDEEGALKYRKHILFDNWLGRWISSETGFDMETFHSDPESEAYKLSDAAYKVAKDERKVFFPSGIGRVQSVKTKRDSKTSSINVELTPEQHEFLITKASMARMYFSAPIINSTEFKESLPAAQAKALQKAYKYGIDEAKKLLIDRFPEIKTQLTDKQVEEDEMDDSVKEQIKKLEKYIPKKH